MDSQVDSDHNHPAIQKKTVLVIALGHLKHDARIKRQVGALSKKYNIIVAALSMPPLGNVSYYGIYRAGSGLKNKLIRSYCRHFRQYEQYYFNKFGKAMTRQLKKVPEEIDAMVCNDLTALQGSVIHGKKFGIPCIFDAHEFYPGEFEESSFKAKTHRKVCEKYLSKLDAMMTVSDKIADLYVSEFNVPKPSIIYNAPYIDRSINEPSETSADKIRLVHHGNAALGRGLENLIEMMDLLDDRFDLTLMLMPSKHLKVLEGLAKSRSNVRIVPPTTTDQIVPTLHQYDMGIFMLPSDCANKRLALPNKFFDCIHAGLGYATWPCSVNMAELVQQHGFGFASDDNTASSMAEALNSLTTEQVRAFKANAFKTREILSYDVQAERLCELVETTIAEYSRP